MIKGRNCSLNYLLAKDWQKNIKDIDEDVIYIIGGLYGNIEALKAIKKLSLVESKKPLLIFNGDIHWFDVLEKDFLEIEKIIEKDIKLLGNVEYELFSNNSNLGCGCNYPTTVSDDVVERSNIIHSIMKKNIKNYNILENIKKREKTIVINYKNKKIAITHGDEKNLAGWDCSRENLTNYDRRKELSNWFEKNNIDILATTHTCLPIVSKFNKSILINNGSSGMANIKNETYGLITRIASNSHSDSVFSVKIDDIFVELVKINFDLASFLEWFDNIWDSSSPASMSYRNRIINGTELDKNLIQK